MTASRPLLAALLLALAVHCAHSQSKAWQDTITLPTWAEGPPGIHPRPDSLDPTRSIYPYTTRLNFTATREPQAWRRLNLENEFLACSFLPDLGGHLYTCTDKRNGHAIFRANPSVKKADVGPRGAWVAMGIEFNFPVAHSRDTVSPVNFGVRQEKDHAEVWLGDVDRVTGMEWLAEFILRDGSAALEQRVTLRNPTSVRHPYFWWANADVELDAGTRFVYPASVMASHGRTDLYAWPRSKGGADLSKPFTVLDNESFFAYGSREPFMAIYNGTSRTAVVHVADPAVVAGKKLFHWGAAGLAWPRKNLSDSDSAFVEMQAGVFENQETYEFLQPHQQTQFTELWMGARDLNGVSRANEHAILSLDRVSGAGKNDLVTQLNAIHSLPGARLAIFKGSVAVWEDKTDLSPGQTYEHAFPNPETAATYRFELRDAAGKLLMSHTEGSYEAVTPASVKLGTQPPLGPGKRRDSPADFLAAAQNEEKASLYQDAEGEYGEGLKKFAADVQLQKARGRLLVSQQRYPEAAKQLADISQPLYLDPEFRYYFGLALAFSSKEEEARKSWTIAAPDAQFGPPALAEMASLEARAGHAATALDLAQKAIDRRPSLMAARKLQVVLLRHSGQDAEARKQLAQALALDPIDSFLRLEAIHLGAKDDELWPHLAADSERVLDIADAYLDFGLYAEALEVLSHPYQAVPANQTEPGATLPQDNPLVTYYRAYCQSKMGADAAPDFKLAQSQRLEYVFPHRASSAAVLAAALKTDPNDASAHFLTALLYLNENLPAEAIAEFKAALAIRKDIPALHYTLGRTLLLFAEKRPEALAIMQEGIALNPSDKELKAALDGALHQPSAAASASSAPVSLAASIKNPGTPEEQARQALLRTADGEPGTLGLFNARDFPSEKQPDIVRWAYIEVQLQALRRSAARKDCAAALRGVDSIGGEDKYLPFTLQGFEPFMKGARFQYFLGAVEALCGQMKSARSRWSKAAKMNPGIASADFAFSAVAAQNLAEKGKPVDLTPWLDKIGKAIGNEEGSKGLLFYSKGILLLAKGSEGAAIEAFAEGVKEPDREFSQYLNQAALVEASHAAPAK